MTTLPGGAASGTLGAMQMPVTSHEARESSARSVRAEQRGRWLLAAGLVLHAIGLAVRPLDEADTFFHLSLGRAVLQAGARVVPEPTAFVDFTEPAIASEWLWSVLSYAVYRWGGFIGLSLLGCVLAGLAALSVVAYVFHAAAAARARVGVAAIAVLTLCVVQCRTSVRPELAVFSVLPLYLIATRRYAHTALPRRVYVGAALVLGTVIWAQLHGSFVLAPVLFVIQQLGPSHAATPADRRSWLRCDGAVLALLLAATFTSAYGTDVSELIGAHASGDAVRHIREMSAPTWVMLNPFAASNAAALLVLLVLGLLGALLERRVALREWLLVALGLALLSTANRFIAQAALLSVPAAVRGSEALAKHFALAPGRWPAAILRAGCALFALALLFDTARHMQQAHGPLGRLGVSEPSFALHASRALAELPDGAAVLTDYTSSAVVGFLGEGRLRTFVDGRTPLYFDDTDYALARELERDTGALQRGITRYGVSAAVVRRESPACVQLAQGWSVALIEPLYTTFVREPVARRLQHVRPCGLAYLRPSSCREPTLAAEITRIRELGARDFSSFLAAAHSVTCADGPDDQPLLHAAVTKLRKFEPSAQPYAAGFERVLVEGLLRTSAHHEATERLLAAITSDRDPGSVELLQLPAAGELPLREARRVLEAYVDVARDEAHPGARASLAEVCARAGDAACARFNAIRAAARGRPTDALDWLVQHGPSERVRRDAARWRDTLHQPSATSAEAPRASDSAR
ncbi:MAG: hypothetical protein ABW321_13555 [Polyangiales bacterium]